MALDRSAPELREEAVLVRLTTGVAMRELRQALGALGPPGRDTGGPMSYCSASGCPGVTDWPRSARCWPSTPRRGW
ncbi:hypothetical protein [Streptomyces sp. NPDC002990]